MADASDSASAAPDLDEELIQRLVRRHAACRGVSVAVQACVDSTNSRLLEQTRDVHGKVLVAQCQSRGRGRRGKLWHSPPRGGVYLSVGWRLARPAVRPLLSMMIAVAVLRALNGLLPSGLVRLKWPNDVLARGRKLAGILLECRQGAGGTARGPARTGQWVIGLGLNVRLPQTLLESIDPPCIDLAALAPAPPPVNVLTGALIVHIVSLLQEFGQEFGQGPGRRPGWLAEWRRCDACAGRDAELLFADRRICGRVEGVDDMGRLCLRVGSRLQHFSAGSLRLRSVQ